MLPIRTCSVTGTRDDETTDAVIRAWEALRRHLETRSRELNAEIAHYPTPIARCDVQLSKLLEQRARLYREFERAALIGERPSVEGAWSDWLDNLELFVLSPEPDYEDDVEISLRGVLKRALAAVRRSPPLDLSDRPRANRTR